MHLIIAPEIGYFTNYGNCAIYRSVGNLGCDVPDSGEFHDTTDNTYQPSNESIAQFHVERRTDARYECS